jgi:hypothetical protein
VGNEGALREIEEGEDFRSLEWFLGASPQRVSAVGVDVLAHEPLCCLHDESERNKSNRDCPVAPRHAAQPVEHALDFVAALLRLRRPGHESAQRQGNFAPM